MKRVLFICTGNTCRSPMAEAMLRHSARERGLAVEVRSAGTSTIHGMPVSDKSIQALKSRLIEHEGTSSPVQAELVKWADYIFTMTEGHKQSLMLMYPESSGKVYTLKEFAWLTPNNEQLLRQLDSLIAELQTLHQLGQPLDEEIRKAAMELEQVIPSFDIVDPFGGSQAQYDACAAEIEQAIHQILDKWATLS